MMMFCRPSCPKCQTTTMLARITPGPSGFDIRTFACQTCDQMHQTVELIDPMRSVVINGWLRGQLTAPS